MGVTIGVAGAPADGSKLGDDAGKRAGNAFGELIGVSYPVRVPAGGLDISIPPPVGVTDDGATDEIDDETSTEGAADDETDDEGAAGDEVGDEGAASKEVGDERAAGKEAGDDGAASKVVGNEDAAGEEAGGDGASSKEMDNEGAEGKKAGDGGATGDVSVVVFVSLSLVTGRVVGEALIGLLRMSVFEDAGLVGRFACS